MASSSSDTTSQWTLCLTCSGKRHVVRLSGEATVQELYQLAATCPLMEHLPKPSKGGKKKKTASKSDDSSTPAFQLKVGGLSPKVIPLPSTSSDDSSLTLNQVGIVNQDRILLEPLTTTACTASSKRKTSTTNTTINNTASSASPSNKRTKRVAATKATESFAETIRQQDAILRQEQAARVTKSKKTTTVRRPPATGSIATGPVQPSPNKKFQAAKTSIGRRLVDGEITSTPRKTTTTTKPKRRLEALGDPTAIALLETLNSTSSAGRILRKGWKRAVHDAYEQSQATARLAAIAGHAQIPIGFEKMESSNSDINNSTSSTPTLKVVYRKGVQGRGHFTEEVDFLPKEVLLQVIGQIYQQSTGAPEALRGENLALLSPRVLWSLVYHGSINDNSTNDDDHHQDVPPTLPITSVHEALQRLRPDLDWSYLRRRREQLSAKARENLRQEQERNQHGQESMDYEKAAEAIESVEMAMAQVQSVNQEQEQRQQREENSLPDDGWKIVTPDELDEDELYECVCGEADNGEAGEPQRTPQHEAVVKALVAMGIHNWRELANVTSDDIGLQLQQAMVDLESIDDIDLWIERAQGNTLEEIMIEICDNSVAAVELLSLVSSTSPKDLAVWFPIAETLQELVLERHAVQQQGPEEDDGMKVPSVDILRRWCCRAKQALEQFPWLEEYATPIQD